MWTLLIAGTSLSAVHEIYQFATVTQDGDEEGILWLDRLPTADEAKAIRRYLGIPKKAELSEETRAKTVAALVNARVALKAAA
jgi:hypothetical protein